MEKIFAIIGMAICLFVTYLFSKEKKNIQWKSVLIAFFGQILLAVLLIKTPLWKGVEWIANGFTWIISQSTEGINFVFGGLTDNFVFFINSLLPIVFISALMGLLFHFNILQKFISVIGKLIARVLKVDTLVAVNGVANMFLGQSESLFVTKSYLPHATDSVIFATLVGGMTSISASVVGLYASYGASMEWIIVSMPLTVFSTFVLTQIIMPTSYDANHIEIENDKGVNAIETMMNYAQSGFKSVIGISVALIVFLSLVSMVNNFIGIFFDGVTMQSILGIVFKPLAVLMGVPQSELTLASEILATKLVTNEAVAFGLPQFAMLSANTKAMITTSLCGFAGIGSIGILIGGYSAIAPNKVQVVAKQGVKALLVATAVNLLTGAVVGLIL
ncbi:MAG: nucleoside transporter C-terminal domain-containing protein [Clostridium sp.]|nr:nucleoside transporter C-terminal domain-containing protein [Clostridium sp.]